MHIKQVIISGFRSFREQNEIEPFSPKHNAIVGRNGSGKSNFFDAIQFVLLGPRFASLRQEDRQHLLHEGAGQSVMAAYVEIIFDNSDGRLAVESDEVVIRRTVGLKKDEFFLNRKRVLKNEIQSLLESAGFSKSNPFYIVQQGKVSRLCVMKDGDRLDLLKEIAGTTVYEERREESIRIMQDSANKQERISEVIGFIEERLAELEKEKEELSEFEQLDKDRRALEHTLHLNEVTVARAGLESIEADKLEALQRHRRAYGILSDLESSKQQFEDAISVARDALTRSAPRLADKHTEVQEATRNVADLEAAILDAEAVSKAREEDCLQLREQLADIERLILANEADLHSIEPLYFEKKNLLETLAQDIQFANARMEALYAKQGRGRQFVDKKQRDKFLQKQISDAADQIAEKKATLQHLHSEIDQESAKIAQDTNSIALAQAENKARLASVDEMTSQITDLSAERNQLQETRKSNWRDLEKVQKALQEARLDLERGKQQLNIALPRNITVGLSFVEKYAEENGITGYYGPLVDNIRLRNDHFRKAVEVAAGNSLFHVVVDTDVTAATFIKEMEKRKAGRLTFLPLNRLRNPTVVFPEAHDAKPLKDIALEYDPMFEEAIKQVFGRKLLAKDLDVASRYSKEYDMDVITTDGDQVNRRGGFEGGFHDDRISRLGSVSRIREASEKIAQLLTQEKALNERSDAVEAAVNDVVGQIQKLEVEKQHVKANAIQYNKELNERSKLIEQAVVSCNKRRAGIAVLQRDIDQCVSQLASYEDEIASPLLNSLSDTEQEELRQIPERLRLLRVQTESTQEEFDLVSRQREAILSDLKNNLRRSQQEKQERLSELMSGRNSEFTPTFRSQQEDAELAASRSDLHFAQSSLQSLKLELKEMELEAKEKQAGLDSLEKSLEALRLEEQSANKDLVDAVDTQEKLLSRRVTLMEIVHKKELEMRDLGASAKDLERFRKLDNAKLMKKLQKTNEDLKKFSGVNKKALEQYVKFNEQRQVLIDRRDELGRDSDAIQQLIDSLDSQKEEAIMRTFTGVSKHFTDVFAELVPGGVGQLVMKTSIDEDSQEDGDDSGAGSGAERSKSRGRKGKKPAAKGKAKAAAVQTSESIYLGVQVKVSFTGTGQQFEMQQLSGGQKALVALTLIFAIQRCDPAPFYLFDEIDQALDANYRSGVARLIQKQVESLDAPAQFITTTFRPELVNVAQKCYGIALLDKVSNIYALKKSDAQDFVTNLMSAEEAVGKAAAIPKYTRAAQSRSGARASRVEDDEVDGEGGEDEDEDEDTYDVSPKGKSRTSRSAGSSVSKTSRSKFSRSILSSSLSGNNSARLFHDGEDDDDDDDDDADIDEFNGDEQQEIRDLQKQVEDIDSHLRDVPAGPTPGQGKKKSRKV